MYVQRYKIVELRLAAQGMNTQLDPDMTAFKFVTSANMTKET